jgi:hypothetical protein
VHSRPKKTDMKVERDLFVKKKGTKKRDEGIQERVMGANMIKSKYRHDNIIMKPIMLYNSYMLIEIK